MTSACDFSVRGGGDRTPAAGRLQRSCTLLQHDRLGQMRRFAS